MTAAAISPAAPFECPECGGRNVTYVPGTLPVCRDCDWTGWERCPGVTVGTSPTASPSVAYRFTLRPASSYHCPAGWVDITPLIPDQQWNYGIVIYPEPLTFEEAQHWSLDPDAGPRVTQVLVDGEPMPFSGAFASADERGCARIRYELAVGVLSPADLHRLAAARSAEFDVAIVLTIDENERGESLPLWRD